ncbi:hypothetical protein NitYY0826_C1731 [Nitratiruptor sp. YY08-26]|uniref:type II secretion system protein n=1 Tax=unclassified Nitratiruptor TaxID=2624044 RepID=UPI0019162B97|nr:MULTISPECIES: prepilin-type N-terminal cleavage/methylation domain-containing protein [unclassified Nitratiruptor]BCD62846.1 hypothetical protein NitYY0813_C1729 [Nitratiruptor sp. YY08-13]BCD66782.1 hypothetical protein NitYY0826_C1731 [Nitratiruptor sp. YY08-26]
MRRGGFTMIELIFVIVILGILAAVALPKFIGVSEQAREGKLKAFVGTLNRTVGPTIWSKAIAKDGTGRIKNLGDDDKKLSLYVDIPQELENIKFSECDDNTKFKKIADVKKDIVPGGYAIYCRDGDSTHAPAFQLKKGEILIAGPAN